MVTEEGILALGGDLHPETLLLAYRKGIFPWPIEGIGLAWFHPDPRAILRYEDLHLSHSLRKVLRREPFRISMNENFRSVILACSRQPRPGQQGSWITPSLRKAYEHFHQLGYAHSVEVWLEDDLVGGLYGVAVDGVFSAESMFHTHSNASKAALVFLLEHLHERGLNWIDIQVMTPHMEALGAVEIERNKYLRLLEETQDRSWKML